MDGFDCSTRSADSEAKNDRLSVQTMRKSSNRFDCAADNSMSQTRRNAPN